MAEEGGESGGATAATTGETAGSGGYDYRKVHNYPLIKVIKDGRKNMLIIIMIL